jgi:GH18 family chitinase
MILVREILVAKPGMASKLAKMMQGAMQSLPDRVLIMTDLTGQFNRVVMQTTFKSLQEFEERMKDYMQNTAMRDRMVGYTEMYTQGSREIYQILE